MHADQGTLKSLAGLWKSIKKYVKNLPPEILGIKKVNSVKIQKMTPGSYNLNFHIDVNQQSFIFRINIEPQSGLQKQAEYEYNILKFLKNQELAPDVYHIDGSRRYFDFDILIEEYLAGPHLSLERSQVIEVASVLAKLHSLPIYGANFIKWQNPLVDTYNLVAADIANYAERVTSDKKIIILTMQILKKFETNIKGTNLSFYPESLNHTDVVCDNFKRTIRGLRMIDWEKPRIDDCTYDLSCFLSEAAQLWCSNYVLDTHDQEKFIEEYARLSGKDAELLREKIRIRKPMVSVHWMIWGATKLCDLKETRTIPELRESHEMKIPRYQKLAQVDNFERILDQL